MTKRVKKESMSLENSISDGKKKIKKNVKILRIFLII